MSNKEDALLDWISQKEIVLGQRMKDNVTNDDIWLKSRGAYDILDEIRIYLFSLKVNDTDE